MPSTGYIKVHAYTSFARIPLEDAAITVSSPDGTVLAMRLTDRTGLISPIPIPTPERSESQTPNPEEVPFTTVNVYGRIGGYEQIESKSLQVFADTVTNLNLEFIPLSELPGRWDQTQVFDTPAQNL